MLFRSSVKERPLIYPTELQQLNSPDNMGNAIVNVFGFSPIRSKYTPSYQSKHFVLEKTNQLLSEGKYFNEKKVFYDMLERNKLVMQKSTFQRHQINATPFIESFKIEMEKFDFESLGCPYLKTDMLQAIKDNNFDLLAKKANVLVEATRSTLQENDIKDYAKRLCMKAEQIKRLVNP